MKKENPKNSLPERGQICRLLLGPATPPAVRFIAVVMISVFCLLPPNYAAGKTAQDDDRFIEGYVSAILDREFKEVTVKSVRVDNGAVTVTIIGYGSQDRRSVEDALASIKGVMRVEIIEGPVGVEKASDKPEDMDVLAKGQLFPKEDLFEPLMAAPRYPHFSLAYHNYLGDEELSSVGATSFGETFYFYKDRAPFDGEWQIGIQAAVFAIFDLNSDSMDLTNADYWVGFPVSYRNGDFSAMTRVYHQSSHLGDEYLLRTRTERVNLSYESVDAKFSYDFSEKLRLYGGGGFIFHKEPADIDPWSLQAGFEFKSSKAYAGGKLRPVLAADFSTWEENDWDMDVSVRTGVQLENERIERKIQFLIEYFNGHSPSGQFYDRFIDYLGFGTHFYF